MMDVDIISGIGWRDIVLVVAAMIGVYVLVSVMRLFKVTGKRSSGVPQEPTRGFSGWQPYSSRQGLTAQPVSTEAAPEFAAELARSSVEVELEQLRRESAHQREQLARLAEEIALLKAARNVSPLYNEAMTLAQQGVSADGIAGHCGISVGEAELVAALARGRNEFGRHEQGEARDERNTGSRN
jgi:hypothetical protein